MTKIGECRPVMVITPLEGSNDMIIKRGQEGRTYDGTPNPTALAAVKRYIKHNSVDKATHVAAGIDLLGLVHDPEFLSDYSDNTGITEESAKASAKATRTTLYHCLMMTVSQSIGIACLEAPVVVNNLLQKWNTARTQPYPDGEHDELIKAVAFMCKSPHDRLVAHLQILFDLPPYPHKYEENKSGVSEKLYRSARTYLKKKYKSTLLPKSKSRKITNNAEELLEKFENGILGSTDLHSWYWLGQYFREAGYNAHEPVVNLIEKHRSSCKPEVVASVDILLEWYRYRQGKTREAVIYLYHALLLIMYRNDERLKLSGKKVPELDADKIYRDLIQGKRYKLDDNTESITSAEYVSNKSPFYQHTTEKAHIIAKTILSTESKSESESESTSEEQEAETEQEQDASLQENDSEEEESMEQAHQSQDVEQVIDMTESEEDLSPSLETTTHECRLGSRTPITFEVVRDDHLKFGTKQRGIKQYMEHVLKENPDAKALMYTGGYNGYGPAVTALGAHMYGLTPILVYSLKPVGGGPYATESEARAAHPVAKAIELGAEVSFHKEWKTVVSQGQHIEATREGVIWPPRGLLDDTFVNALTIAIAEAKQSRWKDDDGPERIWVVGGVGAIASALAGAFPKTQIMVVPATPGGNPLRNLENALRPFRNTKIYMLKRYKHRHGHGHGHGHGHRRGGYKKQSVKPPYPTVQGYDSLAWEGACEAGKSGDVVWNVAS